jgi:16S rRNA (uracil1498-N3)-methyltransferase
MPRLYLPTIHIERNRISITDEKARYLISVLRCQKGDDLVIFDGKGSCFRTTIVKADRREVIADVIEKFSCDTESHINITLVQGLLTGEKMDIVIQKTTELGVKEIIPVVTERSQVRDTRKVTRWRKIAEEASRQSGRSVIPIIREPVEFKKFSANHDPQYKFQGFIFYEEDGMKMSEAVEILKQRFHYTLPSPLPSREGKLPSPLVGESASGGEGKGEGGLFVVIGPEGGFTKEEIALATGKGLLVTSLGKRILRAETAAISAMTLVQYLLGDIG